MDVQFVGETSSQGLCWCSNVALNGAGHVLQYRGSLGNALRIIRFEVNIVDQHATRVHTFQPGMIHQHLAP